MILNSAEKLLLNNPIRRAVQRHYEIPLLLRMSHRLDGKRVLEIGCGQGFGIELILTHFGAATVTGIDLDPDMIARAQRRIQPYADRASIAIGDVTAIQAPDASFDSVFDFGIIHHVPVWQHAIREVRRVLKPGGLFHYGMQAPDGSEMWGKWVFREIVKPERLVFVSSFSDKDAGLARHPMAPTWPIEMLGTATFIDKGGKTLLINRAVALNASSEERATFEGNFDSMKQGWGGTWDQLAAYLATLQA